MALLLLMVKVRMVLLKYIISRRKLNSVLNMIEEINPKAYVTTDMTSPISLKK